MSKHDAIAVFLGNRTSEGTSYNGDKSSPWHGLNTTRWHTGERYFARTIENHGFCRDYTLTVDGAVWTFHGKTERARYEFDAGHTVQTIKWEQKVDGKWVPLCDRIAKKI